MKDKPYDDSNWRDEYKSYTSNKNFVFKRRFRVSRIEEKKKNKKIRFRGQINIC